MHTTTFDDPRFSTVLRELERRADASDHEARQRFGAASADERASLMKQAREDAPRFYQSFARELFLSVDPRTRRLLYMLARSTNARAIVEFGTSFGLSTLYLAAALRDNGGGRLLTAEFVSAKAAAARATFAAAAVDDLVEVREGDALETLRAGLPETIDLVLLDGAKPLYTKVLALLEPRLRRGALVLADNVADAPEYAALVRDEANGYTSLAFSDDVELSMYRG